MKRFAVSIRGKRRQRGPLLLQEGDRLAICGDSITEQKMYSRIIETYLTVCVPQLKVTVRQYGWSGEKTDGFLRRMDQDCLTFQPTIATLAYGMNDSRYRPFDVTNGRWYEDHYHGDRAAVQGSTTSASIVGSPGCAGKIAGWVNSRAGTLDATQSPLLRAARHRDWCRRERKASISPISSGRCFRPRYLLQVNITPRPRQPYEVTGNDGIHPGWAGQVIMAWAFLRAMGLDGDIGTITVDFDANTATASPGHSVSSFVDGKLTIVSSRYPFCAEGDEHERYIHSLGHDPGAVRKRFESLLAESPWNFWRSLSRQVGRRLA